jgi:hypothetical protein
MFRKLILSGVLSVAAIAGLTLTSTSADANERYARHGHRHHERFEIRVRHGNDWAVQATFRDRLEARRELERLRHCGMIVELRPCG